MASRFALVKHSKSGEYRVHGYGLEGDLQLVSDTLYYNEWEKLKEDPSWLNNVSPLYVVEPEEVEEYSEGWEEVASDDEASASGQQYEIIQAVGSGEFFGTRSGDWEPINDAAGNVFDTLEEAEEAIEELRAMGGDWASEDAVFAVREIGARYPLSVY